MKLRWTIILFIINALLLWGIVQQFATSPAERSFNSQVRSFLPLSRADWDGIGVSTSGGDWKVSRDRWGHWWLKSPVEWPAKDVIVSRMDGYLATLQVDSAFAVADLGRVGQSLKSYGLDNPRAVLEVCSGAKNLAYKIGNTTPLGNKVYALSADEKEVWVVDSGLNEYLAFDAGSLRKEGFFPFSIIELESVEIDQAGILTRYERKTGGNLWQLKLGEKNLTLKPGAWENSLTKLSVTQTAEAPADAQRILKGFGPGGRINFQTLYGRQSLMLGSLDKAGQNRFVQWEGEKNGFYIPVSALGILKIENSLESRPVHVNPSDVTAIDWSSGTTVISLRKLEGGAWVIASKGNVPADSEAVKNLLEKLSSIEGKPMIRSNAGLPANGEKIRLQTSDKTLELTVARSNAKDDQKTFASVTAEGGCLVYSVDEWPLRPSTDDLAERRLLTTTLGEITGVVFRTLAPMPHETTYAAASPQAQALGAIVQNSFKAKRWLERTSAEEKEVASPQYQLELEIGSADKSSLAPPTIDLWKTPQGWTGRIEGRRFEADADLARFLDTLTVL